MSGFEINEINFPVNSLRDFMNLCVCNIQICFDGNVYRKIDGMTIESPLRHVLADVFMGTMERKLDNKLANAMLYRRYVDDTLAVLLTTADAYRLLERLNTLQQNIVFTMEFKTSAQLSFVDLKLRKLRMTEYNDAYVKLG